MIVVSKNCMLCQVYPRCNAKKKPLALLNSTPLNDVLNSNILKSWFIVSLVVEVAPDNSPLEEEDLLGRN